MDSKYWEFMMDLLLNCSLQFFNQHLNQRHSFRGIVKLRKYQKLQLISRLKQRRRVLE
jgi:hypothetical protein